MGLLTGIKKLFGEGTIRIEGHLVGGRGFTIKMPYAGDIDTLDEEEIFQHVRDEMLVQHGKQIADLHIVGVTQS